MVIVIGAALTVSIQIWGTNNPYVSLAVLAATSYGVYQAPNVKTDTKGAAVDTGPR